jgi:hypothetical protein
MINPSLISISLSWVIINFIYFFTPTVTRIYSPNSFVNGSAIDSSLPVFNVLIAALRAIIQRRKFQALIPAMPEEMRIPNVHVPAPVHALLIASCALLSRTSAYPPHISIFW